MNSIDFLKEVVTSHSDISTVRTFRFIFNNKIQDRITNFSAPEIAFIHSVQDRKKYKEGHFGKTASEKQKAVVNIMMPF